MAIHMQPLSSHTGVEASGVDLSKPLSESARRELNAAFVRHSVLVIRDQSLEPAELLRAVQAFGTVFRQHNTRFALPECPQIHYISNHDRYPDGKRYIPGAGYHTDHSNALAPPKATVLHAVQLPDEGGDTQFVNMHEAFDTLDDAVKTRLAQLRGVHVYQSRHSERKLMGLPSPAGTGTGGKGEGEQGVPDAVSHPIIRTHPESKRRSVYINPIRIESIEGLAEPEALALLDDVLEHCIQERHQYRHRWLPGDVTLWDNRCLLHKANGDYDMSQTRYLYRVMLAGDVPV